MYKRGHGQAWPLLPTSSSYIQKRLKYLFRIFTKSRLEEKEDKRRGEMGFDMNIL